MQGGCQVHHLLTDQPEVVYRLFPLTAELNGSQPETCIFWMKTHKLSTPKKKKTIKYNEKVHIKPTEYKPWLDPPGPKALNQPVPSLFLVLDEAFAFSSKN